MANVNKCHLSLLGKNTWGQYEHYNQKGANADISLVFNLPNFGKLFLLN